MFSLLTGIGDRMLERLAPRSEASARPDCWVDSQLQGCGPGKLRLCKRTCCYDGSCSAWSCGGCSTP
ncbi:MAG TPA: hypothetical protein H9881_16220 [Candidatus Stackebrandtia excrementipullorum]|nr:hypothetical protein [Candidatus Stackebrandtia excrementipullorum]